MFAVGVCIHVYLPAMTASRRDELNLLQQIEREDWMHREDVARLLRALGGHPVKRLEVGYAISGRIIGMLCHVTGWFMPMYFAGRVEHSNADDYAVAASHADQLKLSDYAVELRRIAEVEHAHELFFLSCIAGHRLLPLMHAIFGWGGELPSIARPASKP